MTPILVVTDNERHDFRQYDVALLGWARRWEAKGMIQ